MLIKSNKSIKISFLSLMVVMSLGLAACTPAAATPTMAPTMESTMAPTMAPAMAATGTAAMMATPTGPAVIMSTQNSTLGTILVDSKGMTLYYFLKDSMNTSACTGACPATWPPFLTNGTPTTTDMAVMGTLGFITLADGSQQVTYNGYPLYYNIGDKAAGDVTGQAYKNLWYVVPAAGIPTSTPAATTAPVTGTTTAPLPSPTY